MVALTETLHALELLIKLSLAFQMGFSLWANLNIGYFLSLIKIILLMTSGMMFLSSLWYQSHL